MSVHFLPYILRNKYWFYHYFGTNQSRRKCLVSSGPSRIILPDAKRDKMEESMDDNNAGESSSREREGTFYGDHTTDITPG